MRRTLILIRHAKSDWGDPRLDDHDRPLNDRGRRSARAVGDWLAGLGEAPEACLLSGARRTVETWDILSTAFETPPEARHDRRLYHASRETIFDVLRKAEKGVVALIGHNPGIGEFAEAIVERPPQHPRFGDYPTCATTVMRFAAPSWAEIAWGTGKVTAFTVPRDLL